MLERWLAARDADAVRGAWAALAPVRHEITTARRQLTLHGAAQLAGAMLGERADWIVDVKGRPPAFAVDRVVDRGFVDHVWDIGGETRETWALHEQRDGLRGVQVLFVTGEALTGRPEGGGVTIVRVFDRDRAASIHVEGTTVATIGDIDLVPLDLYDFVQSFELPVARDGLAMLRSLVADLERNVTITPTSYGYTITTVHGLPWGHMLELGMANAEPRGFVKLRLPGADIDRLLARLGAIATLR
jgi:hypothetical protein